MKTLCVLGIESSCDETGVAIYHSEKGLLANQLHTQVAMHAEYGGIVPELASRDHIQKTLPLINAALAAAKLQITDINGIAYTKGPGLVGALLVGATIAKSLGFALGVPTIGVHHMEAHLLAPMLEANSPDFPFIALLVSGGHTILVEVSEFGKYKILGESLDDAAGEALDKTAKLLGLAYPGGAALEVLAKEGNPKHFHFPRPMTDRPGLDFSFSGLKTLAANTWRNSDKEQQTKANLAYAFQEAIIDTLAIKARRVLEQTQLPTLVIAGGVGANQALREKLDQMSKSLGAKVFYPRPEFCTDNGAMVAYTGCQRLLRGEHEGLEVEVFPRWPIDEITGDLC